MKIILEKTIRSLSKKEIINYKLYANRHNKTDNRKDIALFDAIRNNTEINFNNHKKKDTYKKNSLNASGLRGFDSARPPKANESQRDQPKANTIRKLKVRLLDEVGNSLVQFYFHETPNSYLYNELNLFDVFYQKNEWEVAYFHLQRAEKMAIKTQNFKILDLVYSEYIKLSVYYGNTAPQEYINLRKKNQINLIDFQLFDDALNAVRYELQRNFALIKTPKKLTNTLQQIIESLGRKKEFKNNLVFKQKLFDAVSRLLIAQQEFITLEAYCIKTYNEFYTTNYFTKDTHETKLQLLCYICNSLYENKKYQQALGYLKTLHQALSEFDNLLYDKYLFFYYNSMANNYGIIDSHKAIEILLEAKEIPSIQQNQSRLHYIYLNLMGTYFDIKNYKLALKNGILLKELSSFKQLSTSLQLHILIFEIILRVDLKQGEYVQKSIRDLVKNYHETFNKEEHKRDNEFLNLLKKIYNNPAFVLSPTTKKIVAEFVAKEYNNQNNNVVDYTKWLNEKIRK